jgi:hypothetical protein
VDGRDKPGHDVNANASSRQLCADIITVASYCARAAVDGHVSAVAAGYQRGARRADCTCAIDDFQLSGGLCRRADDLRPDLGSIQRGVDQLKEFGFIKSTIDVPKYADLTLVDEAASRLK